MYNNAPQNNQQAPANQGPNPLIAQLLQQVGNGNFPWLNRWEGVVQVFPSQNNPQGFAWRNGNNGNEGHVVIVGKIRKAWGGKSPGVKQSKIRIKCYGQMGQWIANNIQPGMLLYIKGETICVRFQNNQGQWVDDTHVQIKEAKQGDVTFHILGMLPVIDEARPQNGQQGQGGQQGGYGGNNGGQQQGRGGYGGQQNNGGVQQGQAPQGPVNPGQGGFGPAANAPAAAPAGGDQVNDAPPIDNDDIPF